MTDTDYPVTFFSEEKIFTVTELTDNIKNVLEQSFFGIKLEGEISNYRPSSSGHVYFVIKDANATVSAVLFKGKAQYLNFTPRDGMKVCVRGSISVYATRGTYQIIVEKMEEAGTGDILLMLEQRKRRFTGEGLFDTEKKQSLPFFPLTIGVVTSPTGAALRDIVQIVRRRNPKTSVLVLPCAVQGADAAEQITAQIERANMFNLADVLIVGRGGGSLEDLLPFSEENVVRAIADSKLPVISAVGHEIDWALSDFVADVRAPTPSAGAELAVPLLDDIIDRIDFSYAYDTILDKVDRIKILTRSFSSENFELRFRTVEQPILQRFDDAKEELLFSLENRITDFRNRLRFAIQNLEGANPQKILERGYSVVRDSESGEVIRHAKQTKPGQTLHIIPQNGVINAQVLPKT
ncbi:MAG: exodeoxyribonuclease VII large subunit [Spirochaetales bacterium]